MYMSDAEIRESYTQAADPKKQIQVLADLNATSVKAMKEKLREMGLLTEEKTGRKKGPKSDFDEKKAEELWLQGMNDTAIGEKLGCSAWRVSQWRNDKGLAVNRKRKRGTYEAAEMDELRAMELYNEGLCDLDIAEALGVKKWKVGDWRRMMRLPANVKQKQQITIHVEDTQETAGAIHAEELKSMEKEKVPADVEHIAPEEKNSEEIYMSAGALLEILQRLHEAYPGEKVTIRTTGEGYVWNVLISVSYNAMAELDGVELTLMTE